MPNWSLMASKGVRSSQAISTIRSISRSVKFFAILEPFICRVVFKVYAQKTSFTRKSLRHVRQTLHMAQKMGKELGKCQILQQALQLKSSQILTI
jgi:hypothetical protein